MNPSPAAQLLTAAAWAAREPGYEASARLLRELALHVLAGELDLSRLPPPSETEAMEAPWSGLLVRLKRIGIDVWEMCPRAEEAA